MTDNAEVKSQINRLHVGQQYCFYGNIIILWAVCLISVNISKGYTKIKRREQFPLLPLCVMSDVVQHIHVGHVETPPWEWAALNSCEVMAIFTFFSESSQIIL